MIEHITRTLRKPGLEIHGTGFVRLDRLDGAGGFVAYAARPHPDAHPAGHGTAEGHGHGCPDVRHRAARGQ